MLDLTWPQGRFMNDQNFKYLSPSKFDFHLIFKNFENPRNFLLKSANIFCFAFTMYTKRTMFTIKIEYGLVHNKILNRIRASS